MTLLLDQHTDKQVNQNLDKFKLTSKNYLIILIN